MKNSQSRTKRGSSLIFVTTIAAIAVTAALVITDSLLTANRGVASQQYFNETSSIAENALQYTLASLNQSASLGTLSNGTMNIILPAEISKNANVNVIVQQIASNADLQQSPIFLPLKYASVVDPVKKTTTQTALSQDYRLITAQVINGNVRRTLNVIVGPQPYKNPGIASPQQTPFFNGALFSDGLLTLQNGIKVTDASGAFGANVGSNQSILFSKSASSGTTAINGSLSAPIVTIPTAINPMISGDLNVNSVVGQNQFLADDGVNKTPTVLDDNVTNGNYPKFGAASASTLAPAPTVAATVSANLTPTGNTDSPSVLAQPSGGNISDLGSVNFQTSGQKLTLSPGQYTASSITMGPGTILEITAPVDSSSTGVQIYLQGNSGGNSAFSMQGAAIRNSSASNLQIFYNGSQSITITPSTTFAGLIYAPRSSVVVDTSGGQFSGAITAGALSVSGPNGFQYDPGPGSASTSGKAASPGFLVTGNGSQTDNQYFNILSWQEKSLGAAN